MATTFIDIMSEAGASGRRFYSFEDYDKALDKAIGKAMQNPEGKIQKNAKQEITDCAENFVYRTYSPKFWSRRYGEGGILDVESYRSSQYSDNAIITKNASKGFTLHIYADAQWQQLFGGSPEGNPDTLTEAIEKNGLYGAQPRPYMEHAETNYGYGGQFEKDLVEELESDGF